MINKLSIKFKPIKLTNLRRNFRQHCTLMNQSTYRSYLQLSQCVIPHVNINISESHNFYILRCEIV